jgi:hypothetical protein
VSENRDGGLLRSVSADGGLAESRHQAGMAKTRNHQQIALFMSIALGALALRMVWLLRGGGQWTMTPDSVGYVALARGLLHGCGFAVWTRGACGPPEVLRTPAYPVMVALLGCDWRAILFAQAIMGGLLALTLGFFAWRHFSFRAAILTALLVATDVPSILASKEIETETMFQFVLALGILLIASGVLSSESRHAPMKAACGGVLVAVAALVRPVGELLVPVLWLPFALATPSPVLRRICLGAIAVAASVAVLLCWCARNYAMADTWTLSTDGAFAAYYYATPPLLRGSGQNSIQSIRHELVSRLHPRLGFSATKFPGSIGEPDYDSLLVTLEERPRLGGSMYQAFAKAARGHLLDEAVICAQGLLQLAFEPYSPGIGLKGLMRGESSASTLPVASNQRNAFHSIVWATVAFQVLWLLLAWSGALMALVRVWRSRSLTLASVPIALWVFTMLLLIAPSPFFDMRDLRYRTPIVPFLALLAGIGWFGEANHHLESRER